MQKNSIEAEKEEYSGPNVLEKGNEKLFYRQFTCCLFLSRDHERRSMAEMRG
jgi:hypothetical protein